MRYYETEEMPYMSFSRTGEREDEEPHAFLGMEDRHQDRMYAVRMLLYLWNANPGAKIYLDGQVFCPTDDEFAEAREPHVPRREVRSEDSGMPEALVSASVEIDELLHEEDEPRRESIRDIMARARVQKQKVKPCKKGSGGIRAMMRAGQR